MDGVVVKRFLVDGGDGDKCYLSLLSPRDFSPINLCENITLPPHMEDICLECNSCGPLLYFDDFEDWLVLQIIQKGLMSESDYIEASKAALSLFAYGQRIAREHGLILVDTKYEFGKGSDGAVLLIDEVHTPDSSRYWIADSYEDRFQNGLEPENIDKVYLPVRDDNKIHVSTALSTGRALYMREYLQMSVAHSCLYRRKPSKFGVRARCGARLSCI